MTDEGHLRDDKAFEVFWISKKGLLMYFHAQMNLSIFLFKREAWLQISFDFWKNGM